MEQIPPELWAQIFQHARAEGRVDFYEMCQTPWAPSQVCTKWREITKSHPLLWSTLVLHEATISKNRVYHNLPMFKFRLARFLEYSRDGPLKIRLWTSSWTRSVSRSDEAAEVSNMVMEMLWPHRSRWVELSTDYRGWNSCAANIGDSVERPMPMVRRLNVTLSHKEPSACQTFFSLFSRLPSVSAISFIMLNLDVLTSEIQNIHWPDLRNLSLDIQALPTSALFALLAHLNHVTILRLSFFRRPGSAVPHNVTFPNLEGASLASSGAEKWFLSNSIAPRLETLDCSALTHPPMLSAFLTRTNCPLRHLYIHHCHHPIDEFADILHEMPTLELLAINLTSKATFLKTLMTLGRAADTDGVAEHLKQNSALFPCPKLQSLHLSVVPGGQSEKPHGPTSLLEYVEALRLFIDNRVLTTHSEPGHRKFYLLLHTGEAQILNVAAGAEYMEYLRERVDASDEFRGVDMDISCYQPVHPSGKYLGPRTVPTGRETVSCLRPDSMWRNFEAELVPGCAADRLFDFCQEAGHHYG